MRLKDYVFRKGELQDIIKDHSKYFAHLSKDEKTKESLIDHILLTQEYFFKLVERHNLEGAILNLTKSLISRKYLQERIGEIFIKSIAIHDFGKVNPKFQKDKMKNNDIEHIEHNLSSSHSLISAYIYVLYSELLLNNDVSKEDEIFIDTVVLAFSYPILMHHSPYLDKVKGVEKYKENLEDLKKFVRKFSCFDKEKDFLEEINNYVIPNIDLIIEKTNETIEDECSLFLLVKLLYSLLTASDYYATTHFMNNWKKLYDDFGILDDNSRRKIIENIKTTKEYNRKVYEELDNYKIEFPEEQNHANLNKLRQSLATEVIRELRKNLDKNLFYIEAPTGSGKTNLSMLVLSELLQNTENGINKVFYVFPFITLITQTYQSLKETLALGNNEIVQIHSKSGLLSKENDDIYGSESKAVIDYLFMNYPISLISHVKFFDILKSNDKSSNYLLHRLANSVVIIDELQAYPPKEWDKIVYFITRYSKLLNMKFILMSATLPKIDKLLFDLRNADNKFEFVSLVKNKNRYFGNPNFKNRVQFNYDLLDTLKERKENRDDYLNELWDKVIDESEKYKERNGRVHTIVEFIYNKTAGEFTQLVKENNFFDEIFLLSGTILEPRRKEIIIKLKSKNYTDKNILLISTQVVEAGVDIDMDIGFKDISLVDSDEQLAGRINRNVKKDGCKLFLFDFDKAGTIYGSDYRYKLLNNLEIHKEILESKDFDKLYKIVIEHKNELNKSSHYININDYIKQIKTLDFISVDRELNLIDGFTVSIFVPLDIPIKIPGSNEENFSKFELEFLESRKAILLNDMASGQRVWEIYYNIIENKDSDFLSNKKQQIVMQGVISKFVFSVLVKSENYNNLVKSGNCEEKYGFLFLHNVDEIYSYEMGILPNNEHSYNFW